jgi:hypothetical protein
MAGSAAPLHARRAPATGARRLRSALLGLPALLTAAIRSRLRCPPAARSLTRRCRPRQVTHAAPLPGVMLPQGRVCLGSIAAAWLLLVARGP